MKKLSIMLLSMFMCVNIMAQKTISLDSVGGVFQIECVINDMPLKFVFDTGASDLTISMAEFIVMRKQGLITDEEIIGERQYMDASGKVSSAKIINIKSVKIGNIEVKDVQCSIMDNPMAPLLFGIGVIRKFGSFSMDIDKRQIKLLKQK